MYYPVEPVAKPRMTRSDRWKKRPVVEKYWRKFAWATLVELIVGAGYN